MGKFILKTSISINLRELKKLSSFLLILILVSPSFAAADFAKTILFSGARSNLQIIEKRIETGIISSIRGGLATQESAEIVTPAATGRKAPFYPSVFDEDDTDSFTQREDAAAADRLLEKGSDASDEDEEEGSRIQRTFGLRKTNTQESRTARPHIRVSARAPPT